ncbi:MAG TPA: hypothetical protein DD451_01415 [Candidatus Moranbacteria bacterium]|nr:hypothetical protein [Candidatus Moranbacteria bacterium]
MKTKIIINSIVSLMMVFVFLNVQAAPNCSATPGFVLDPSGVCVPSATGLPDPVGNDPVATILINVMQWLLGSFGVVAIIAFAISGLQYMLAAGNDNVMEKAKRNMLYSIIGVAVGLAGLLIVIAINNMLAGGSTF